MKKYFSIVKNAYLWLFVALCATIASWVLFIFNAEFSEEFTGGVSIEFRGQVSESEFSEALVAGLQEKGFPKLKINLDQTSTSVKIKINTTLESDEKVNQLSNALPQYLLENEIVSSEEEIISQAVVGPSV